MRFKMSDSCCGNMEGLIVWKVEAKFTKNQNVVPDGLERIILSSYALAL